MSGTAQLFPWDELLHRAETEPINCDVSDYGDEWCAGFLAGQRSVLEEVHAQRLRLPPDAPHDCEYRIEADCAMRDYDALELEAGVMRAALEKIARTVGIVTRVSDGVDLRTAPEYTGQGAHDIAVAALAQLRVTP